MVDFEIRLLGKEWKPATEEEVREVLGMFYLDVDEVIADMISGVDAYAGCDIRVKQPQPIKE